MNHGDQVQLFKYVKAEGKDYHIKKPCGWGLFQEFGADSEEVDSGVAIYSAAIIQRGDGFLELFPVDLVKKVKFPKRR